MQKAVADSIEQDKKTVADICNAFLFKITEKLKRGWEVSIAGFGKFRVAEHAGRKWHDTYTGEEIVTSAYKIVHFSTFKKLKKR